MGVLTAGLLLLACGAEETAPQAQAPAAAKPRASAQASLRPLPMRAKPTQFVFSDVTWDTTHPDMAVAADGHLAIAWVAFSGKRDRIFASVREGAAWSDSFPVSPDETLQHLSPRIIADPQGGFLVAWSAEVDGRYELFAARILGEEVGEVQRLTRSERHDIAPALVAGWDGRVWLAWQSYGEGRWEIRAMHRDGEQWSEAWSVTDDPASDIQPSVAIGPSGAPWIAWTSWRDGRYADGNYEVYAQLLDPLLRRDAAPQKVSTSVRTDMYPSLVTLRDRLALVWTESYFPRLSVGGIEAVQYDNWADKVYHVAWLKDGRFGEPLAVRASPDQAQGSVAAAWPTALPGPDGSDVWLLYGERLMYGAFDRPWAARLLRLDESGASQPVDVSGGVAGPTQRYAAVWKDGLLWTVDTVTIDLPSQPDVRRDILRLRPIPARKLPERMPIQRLEGATRSPIDPELDLSPPPEVRSELSLDGRRYRAYFGNLHVHSDYSGDRRGFEGGVQENYQVLRDIAQLDFAGLSDHAEGLRPDQWWESRKLADLWNEPGRFVTLPGYEWTSLRYGHKNVFFPDTSAAPDPIGAGAESTPDELWAGLAGQRALTIPHHTSHGFRQPTDWSFRNDEYQRLVEIFQKRGSYEYDGAPVADIPAHFEPGHSVRDALAMGHRLGIIASPDHGGGLGLAGVWATDLTRPALWEALHARRTFGTSGAKMELLLTIDGAPQGSEIAVSRASLALHAEVNGSAPLVSLTLVRDGEEIQTWPAGAGSHALDLELELPPGDSHYYYLRATQSDGHLGWTSPIWISQLASP